MPTVVNGIGTWYYGKDRIHRHKDVCGFCDAVGELESYDTTLYFVFLFIPLLPLSRKRILEQCPYCQKHRVMSLAKWEEIKSQDIAQMLERLRQAPDDRDTILPALALAMTYQDESLFNRLASALAEHRREDAAIQAQLGVGYAYFARYPEAEAAYRASLAVEDNPDVRQQLALALLKQSRPEEAHPYLRPILEQGRQSEAGMIYLLVEAYQAQGMHREALELMDQRDAAFPDLAGLKEYKKQRKTSERYLHSGKKVPPAFLSESSRVGYREGGWKSRVPRVIAPLLLLALLILYLGSAVWIGRSRKVFLVNGWDQPYTVTVNGREQTLRPGSALDLRVPEGEVVIEFRGAKVPLEPVRCRVETSFFSRPFTNRTFVLNPDQLAVLVWEQAEYAEVPLPAQKLPQLHVGQALHVFQGMDYEFAPFPQTLSVKKGQTLTRTRVGLEPNLAAGTRLALVKHALSEKDQVDYIKRWLHLSPDDVIFLSALLARVKEAEMIDFLRPGLAVRPLRLEWHRAYQYLMDRIHPQQDLRPEYQRLVEEMGGHADAVYLLARVHDVDEADKLFLQAAEATPPSAYAVHAVGFDALARGQFADAVKWTSRAVNLAPDSIQLRQMYRSALLAAGAYDRLLEELRGRQLVPGLDLDRVEQVRVLAAKGDQAQARAALEQAVRPFPAMPDARFRQEDRAALEMVLCCVAGDATGFLKLADTNPNALHFERAFLRGKLADAAEAVDRPESEKAVVQHALLYLAALKARDQKMADGQWQLLLASLEKADRHSRRLGDMLAGRRPLDKDLVRRLPIDPKEKRALLVVVVRRHPDQEKELLPLARALDFYRDETSLCLRKVLEP